MSDISRAKKFFETGKYTCVLCKDEQLYLSEKKGIAPVLDLIESGTSLEGFSAADKIIGRAAALLFILGGAVSVYGEVMSKGAAELFEKHGIRYSYETLTERIINRTGTGICPMEEATKGIDDPAEALEAIRKKRKELTGKD